MKIVNEFPPNYSVIQRIFPLCEEYQAIFCYGDVIFNPFKIKIRPDQEAHEEVHSNQQAGDPEKWWFRYLNEPEFRLQQEIEAYGNQFAFFKKLTTDNKLTQWFKGKLAQSLSSPLYGNLIDYHRAEGQINRFAKNL